MVVVQRRTEQPVAFFRRRRFVLFNYWDGHDHELKQPLLRVMWLTRNRHVC
jgi:hypothetical protein